MWLRWPASIWLSWRLPVLAKAIQAITEHCDIAVYVMTPEYGAASQLEKI